MRESPAPAVETLIVDSSVWLAAHDANDPQHQAAAAVVQASGFDLAALDLTLYEVANIATVKWHDVDAARRLVGAIGIATEQTLIRADAELLTAAAAVARDNGLSVYDAAYVVACQKTGWRLVSLDSDLTNPGFADTPSGLLAL